MKNRDPFKSTAHVSCPVHVALVKFSGKYRLWLIENGKPVFFLPIHFNNELLEVCSTIENPSSVYWFTGPGRGLC